MKLDDLRSILLSERETGRLTAVAPDIFEKGHAELATITKKVYASEDPFSDEARALIDETLSIRETIQDLFAIRSRKILALTIMHAEGSYYDREEVKRMIPAEKEMFGQMTASIEQCQGILLHNIPHSLNAPRHAVPVADAGSSGPEPFEEEEPDEGMDSFMGVDGRIYTLAKGDIVTLPERNAAVLSERNIVLNINLCK